MTRGRPKKKLTNHGQTSVYRTYYRKEIDRLRQVYGVFQAFVDLSTLADASQRVHVKLCFKPDTHTIAAVSSYQGHLERLLHHPVRVEVMAADEKLPIGWGPL